MFGISLPELLVVLGIALLVVGPDKLPDAARGLARMLAQFRKGSDELRRDFYNAIYPPLPPAESIKHKELSESEKPQAENKEEVAAKSHTVQSTAQEDEQSGEV